MTLAGQSTHGALLPASTNRVQPRAPGRDGVKLTAPRANTKAQFEGSPTLKKEFLDAVIDSDEAFDSMSRQALNSERLREELLKILLGPGDLYGAPRRRAGAGDFNA